MYQKITYSVAWLSALTLSAAIEVHEGELDGAPYTVAAPTDWSGGPVFFHVSGWRPSEAPHLADLDVDDPFYVELLQSGWAIGRTAFKENGVDHPAHTLALRDLKAWIASELGPVETLILEGESTAGTLVLRIAEQDADLADGVIAMGGFYEFEDSSLDSYLEATPGIPAFLMSNTTEIEGPVGYAVRGQSAAVVPSLRPLLRPGHVNVNWIERLAALRDMEQWLAEGHFPGLTDGTRAVPERDTGTVSEGGFLVNSVTATNVFYGNAFLGYHPDEWTAAGLEQGTSFEIEAHGQRWPVFFGTSYGDVSAGEWVAFPTADDQIMLVRNHKSAIETANLSVGDVVKVRALE